MGGAVRSDEFVATVGPHLGSGANSGVKRFTTFDLAERYEQDDTCDVGGKVFYHKSLLYLVARGLESGPDRATGVVPLVGLEATLDRPVAGDGRSLRQVIDASGGRIVIAPGGTSLDLRSDAKGHGDFDNDQATLNAVLLRMLRKTSLPVFGAAGAKASGAKAGASDAAGAVAARGDVGRRLPRPIQVAPASSGPRWWAVRPAQSRSAGRSRRHRPVRSRRRPRSHRRAAVPASTCSSPAAGRNASAPDPDGRRAGDRPAG